MLSNVPARFAESAAGMAIDRENVLKVAAVLTAEADRLQRSLNEDGKQRLGLCGGDPVSRDAKRAFDQRADLLVDWHQKYVDDLRLLAASVRQAARSYGHSEADIAASFRR
ncbi:MAG: hypothetical protein EKK42_29985 [Pseudonocardiaceae bacterium]|nr:MAG: hypothetical protein EKK42_29985 [Pseudonocardiaceae bacterium]